MGLYGQADRDAGSASATVIQKLRKGLLGLFLLSGFMQMILLGGALLVMLLFDIILPGRNGASLVGLLLLSIAGAVALGAFQVLRARMLIDMSEIVHSDFSQHMPAALQYVAVYGVGTGDGQQPLDDLGEVRSFLASSGAGAMMDAPWSLLAMLALFLVHIWLGTVALVALIILTVLGMTARSKAARPLAWLAEGRSYRRLVADEQRRQVEAVQGLGMRSRVAARWVGLERRIADVRREHERTVSILAIGSGALRLIFFVILLVVAIALAFDDRASVGVIVASAILLYQTLAPAERAMEAFSDFVGAKAAWTRLTKLEPMLNRNVVSTFLPPPVEALEVSQLAVGSPGRNAVLIQGIGFLLTAGKVLAVVGHSGSGKSVLARAVAGMWRPIHGVIRLDGATLDQWDDDVLGGHVGYMPQGNELMSGTVGENIARFDFDARSDEIIAAAEAAGVHEQILRLADGYETEVGRDGRALPPGLRQRIGLARALFRDPFLVVLDDPHSSLDVEGEAALTAAINRVSARGGIVIVIAYRMNLLPMVDHIMVMRQGTMAAFGPPENILPRLTGKDSASGAIKDGEA